MIQGLPDFIFSHPIFHRVRRKVNGGTLQKQ